MFFASTTRECCWRKRTVTRTIRLETTSMQTLLTATSRRMLTSQHKVGCHLKTSIQLQADDSTRKLKDSFRNRSTSEDSARLLANGLGSAVLSDRDDDENHGARACEMSPVLGVDRRRVMCLWKLYRKNDCS